MKQECCVIETSLELVLGCKAPFPRIRKSSNCQIGNPAVKYSESLVGSMQAVIFNPGQLHIQSFPTPEDSYLNIDKTAHTKL